MFSGSRPLKKRADIEGSENISRYILTKRQYSQLNKCVKYGAYLPAQNGEASVFRTDNLNDIDIWSIGKDYVAIPRKKKLYARGDSIAINIFNTGLMLKQDTVPHPLHANIIEWPAEKDEQKMLAIEIANNATLFVNS